jgi:hypothetical protein
MRMMLNATAAVAALAVAAMGTTAHAARTIAGFSNIGSSANISWTEAASPSHGGALSASSLVTFSFTDSVDSVTTSPFTALLTLAGTSKVEASSTSLPGGPPELVQGGIDGTFSIANDSGAAVIIDGKSYAVGATVLSGAFQDGQIEGLMSDSNSTVDDSILIGDVTYTASADPGVTASPTASNSFSLTGTSVMPTLALKSGSLRSFKGTFTGSFVSAPVPETTSWVMMIVGIGGVGAMARARRRSRLEGGRGTETRPA